MGVPAKVLDTRLTIMGMPGSGKSTTAKGLVETLLDMKRRVCIVDLTDAWRGLRLTADRKKTAYPLVIFGGANADIPITANVGAVVGQAVARSNSSCIVSLSELDDDAERRKFALAFFNALYKVNRSAIYLVIDEADFYCPQNPVKDGPSAPLLNRVKEIVSRGRLRGFQTWTITQRPAKMNNDVLSIAETVIAMQLTLPHDREAMERWMLDNADRKEGTEILSKLSRLSVGHGVIWSPRIGLLRTQKFPMPKTFDSMRAPEHGGQAVELELKPIDIGNIREGMAKVEEELRNSDVTYLQQQLAELRRQKAQTVSVPAKPSPEMIQAARDQGYNLGLRTGMRLALDTAKVPVAEFRDQAVTLVRGLELPSLEALIKQHVPPPAPQAAPKKTRERFEEPSIAVASNKAPETPRSDSAPPPAGTPHQRILDALAWFTKIGTVPVEQDRVCLMAGYSPNASTFFVYLGQLIKGGDVERPERGKLQLLPQGSGKANWPEAVTREELKAVARRVLQTEQARKAFDIIHGFYPGEVSRDRVIVEMGLSPGASTGHVYLGQVTRLGIAVKSSRGHLKAADWLFP